ncbi:trypsin-like peptidase domain-containing protein [Pendulispora rubella]|uniref:Serine protease n=1 Tax=Pendulispora rubella TaxID=2741070 RepID=A0ABZ2L5S3_9BACT
MKIGMLFLASSVSVLAACAGADDSTLEDVDSTGTEEQALRVADHPDFVRKMRDREHYVVNRELATTESICGVDDKQYVNSYNGALGVSQAFVAARKRPVGAMETSPTSGKYCTGTLISSNLFLTAGHCVDSSTVGDYVSFNYEYNAAGTATLPQSHYQITAIVEDALGSVDYAIVRLAGTPGSTWGTTAPLVSDPAAGATLAIIQHPSGDRKQIEAGTRLGLSGNYMTYGNIDTEPGSSGSGILNANGRLVGVHTNGGCTSSGGSNSGVRMTRISAVSAVL